jgi:hypothetical protein
LRQERATVAGAATASRDGVAMVKPLMIIEVTVLTMMASSMRVWQA